MIQVIMKLISQGGVKKDCNNITCTPSHIIALPYVNKAMKSKALKYMKNKLVRTTLFMQKFDCSKKIYLKYNCFALTEVNNVE